DREVQHRYGCHLSEYFPVGTVIPMEVAGSFNVVLASANRLLLCWFRGIMNWFDLPGKVHQLISGHFGQSWAIAASMEMGVAFHWLGADETRIVAADMPKP